jgi:hypothetical protein
MVNKKLVKVLSSGLKPILCIGETKEEYEAGLNKMVRGRVCVFVVSCLYEPYPCVCLCRRRPPRPFPSVHTPPAVHVQSVA